MTLIIKIVVVVLVIAGFLIGRISGYQKFEKNKTEQWVGAIVFDDDDVYASFATGSLHGLKEGDTVKLGVHYK